MFDQDTIRRIQDMVSGLTGHGYEGTIEVVSGEGLSVRGDKARAVIACQSIPALARGFLRLYQEIAAGKETVNVREAQLFESCGCQIDCSRNAVMTVPSVKRYMDMCAAMGMNLILLYTEDTYTVPEYPHFGYLRGRYTPEELREMDDHAASLGMELVISMQTLSHLEQFLQWPTSVPLRDTADILLIDEEATYEFIEAQIRALRPCVRSNRLHIGMDEAHGVGLGRYYAKHGPTDRFELLTRHLTRVVAICEKYGFKPMMWSDMFFRLGSKHNDYYDPQADIPQAVIDSLPQVDMVYWDYYHTSEELFDHMLTEHARMGNNTVFAGGVWTWSGFLPQVELTYASMEPALRMCAKHQVKTVFATMWGDDGQETNHFLAMSQVAMFSEFCWRGDACDREAVVSTAELITGLPRQAYEAFGLFYPGPVDSRPGKKLIYCDLLYPLGPAQSELDGVIERSEKALRVLETCPTRLDCLYAAVLFDICKLKASIIKEIRPRYLAGDRAYLAHVAEDLIPVLLDMYDTLRERHKMLWERDYKRNGWEVMALRYGAVTGRLRDVQNALLRYAGGKLSTLCELEETPIEGGRSRLMRQYSLLVSPMYEI